MRRGGLDLEKESGQGEEIGEGGEDKMARAAGHPCPRAAADGGGPVKRPLIREDLKVINISPRRLITLLLHQMVHHHTTLRGSGQ